MEQCSYKILRSPVTLNAKENTVCSDVRWLCLVVTYRHLGVTWYFCLPYSMFTQYLLISRGEEFKLHSVKLFRCESRRNPQIAISKRTGSILERTVVCCIGRYGEENYFYRNGYKSQTLQDHGISHSCLLSSRYVLAYRKSKRTPAYSYQRHLQQDVYSCT